MTVTEPGSQETVCIRVGAALVGVIVMLTHHEARIEASIS